MFELYEDAPVTPAPLDGIAAHVVKDTTKTVTLLGWGATNSGMPDKLLKVDVPYASIPACRAAEPSAVKNNWLTFDPPNVICTGGNAGKDSCNGDSGGPAAMTQDGVTYLVGVLVKGTENPTSNGGCGVAGRFGVYTRISRYREFIETTMSGGTWTCPNCFTGSVRTSCTKAPEIGGPAPPGLLSPLFGENQTIVVSSGGVEGSVAAAASRGYQQRRGPEVAVLAASLGLAAWWAQ